MDEIESLRMRWKPVEPKPKSKDKSATVGHFDHKASSERDWCNNPRRFLLKGRPQIGKTGVMHALIFLIWKELGAPDFGAAPRVLIDTRDCGDASDTEAEDIHENNVGAFPKYDQILQQSFRHPPQKSLVYGDPGDQNTWNAYVHLGERAPAAKRTIAPLQPTRPASSTHNGLVCSPEEVSGESQKGCTKRFLAYGPSAAETNLDARSDARESFKVDLGDDVAENVGELLVPPESLTRDWEQTPGSSPLLRLRFYPPETYSDDRMCMPIFTPSKGRAQTALLDLSRTMIDPDWMRAKHYSQIVCVKRSELEGVDGYRTCWPKLTLFVLPEWAEEKGVGAVRFCIKRLATLMCPKEFPFAVILDDNVWFWEGLTLCNDPEPQFGDVPSPNAVHSCEVSLWQVLRLFQQTEHRAELDKFSMLGFRRRNPTFEANIKAPYARAHVYKCVIVNLAKLSPVDYNRNVFVWEDIDFNKRTLCCCHPAPTLCEEAKLSRPCVSSVKEGRDDLTGSAVIVKFQRFALTQNRKLGGGVVGGEMKSDSSPLPPSRMPTTPAPQPPQPPGWTKRAIECLKMDRLSASMVVRQVKHEATKSGEEITRHAFDTFILQVVRENDLDEDRVMTLQSGLDL